MATKNIYIYLLILFTQSYLWQTWYDNFTPYDLQKQHKNHSFVLKGYEDSCTCPEEACRLQTGGTAPAHGYN